MALQQWAIPELSPLLPLDESELKQIVDYASTLSDAEAARHFGELLGDSPEALRFITSFNEQRGEVTAGMSQPVADSKGHQFAPPSYPPPSGNKPTYSNDTKQNGIGDAAGLGSGSGGPQHNGGNKQGPPPSYAPPAGAPPVNGTSRTVAHHHTNQVIEAAKVRAKDEVCFASR